MTPAAQNGEGSSPHNATNQPSRKDVDRGLVRESFDRILDILQQLSLHEKSPKLFIIYAHDNEKSDFEAYQDTVKEYISWFKKIRFNVDSDRSPHGYGPAHGVGHSGASNDIFMNQVCLLPKSWHKHNVDYVLVFYSEVLASYMKDERNFKLKDQTYSDAIIDTCQSLRGNFRDHSQVEWNKGCGKIRDIQQRYHKAMEAMGTSFHHVMTETALLSFTNQYGTLDKTIPIILSGDEDWKADLKWQPQYIKNKDTQIRITIKPGEEYRQFFKILLEFETLERDRPLIDIMTDCFEQSIRHLEDDLKPEAYHKQVEVLIFAALQKLNDQWQKIERPITRGDIRSRLDLYSKLDCESIRRISGETLPGSLKDIDLAVTERLDPGDKGPEKGQRDGKENAPLYGLSEEEGKKQERQMVPLHGLFDERNVGEKNIRPQRILIQGRPGIGKTTLCRRLMYEYSWHENLRMEFDLVVRIPLRKLEYSADLNNLLFEEYFQAVSEGRSLSNKLAGLILDNEGAASENRNASSVKILIILDGLDEARRWSEERRALLEKLMQRPAVIITSRSYNTDMFHVSVDLRLEALGLSMMSVEAYLDNTEIVPSDTATEIHRFIESNPFIKDMVRVPIHLDILCYSWDELHGQNALINDATDEVDNVTPRTTPLYQAVVRSLWRKDITVLGKLDHGEPVNVEVINAVRSFARLERLIRIESTFLEQIALYMMHSNRLEFTDEDIVEAIQRLESDGHQLPLSLERNLHKLSFLHSYASDSCRKFSFVHPTFQEFFAARYLVRHLTCDRAPFKTLLNQHKYDRQWQVVWTFLTGLLSKVEELDFFFDLLDDEPRDLMGLQHIRLLTYCLSECQMRIRPSRWSTYQKRLEDWLRLEVWFAKEDSIGSFMAFPENILREQRLLETVSAKHLTEIVIRRKWISKSLIERINQLIVSSHDKDEFKYVGSFDVGFEFFEFLKTFKTIDFSTMWTLEQGAKLPAETISIFMEQIREGKKLQSGAISILESQRQLPDVAIKELTEWLKDYQLSEEADRILGKQEMLPKETIDSAIESLFHSMVQDPMVLDLLLRWDLYESSIFLRQDLHAEAIGKVCDYLENVALRGDQIPDSVLLKVSRMHLLRPDDAERLGKLLARRLSHYHRESRKVADEALGQQAGRTTDVLKILLRLLHDEHSEIFRAVQHLLRKEPALDDDIIDKLRALFNNDKDKVVAVLKESLQLPHKAFKWLVRQVTEGKDADFRCHKAVDFLLGQSDLPNYLTKSLPELIAEGVDFELVAKLLCEHKALSTEVLGRFFDLIPPKKNLDEMVKFFQKDAFAGPLIRILEQTRSETVAETIESIILTQTNLHQESIQRLRSLLTTESTTGLADMKSRIAYYCLVSQVNLDRETILDLHKFIQQDILHDPDRDSDIYSLWESQHVEQFCTNLTLFDAETISIILQAFLSRPIEDLTPAYIDGNTLYFYTADGNLTNLTLEDEEDFRKRFREAQRMAEIPEWAWIKEPQGREEQNPSSAPNETKGSKVKRLSKGWKKAKDVVRRI